MTDNLNKLINSNLDSAKTANLNNHSIYLNSNSIMTILMIATIGQVSNAMQNMYGVAQKSSENAEIIKTSVNETTKSIGQVAITAQSKGELAQKLNELVHKFKL
ncbi:hypothetical protein I6U51_06385 [Clostridium aciditolerans]|uniref:Methyl-accepting chemotaxis protein n=1 Tax=Clostridium aciditolerans TaxID=339861 RepID=A0A934HXS5_9CLOT|nr:hypothetical protein [Clostridium aciditolerans]